MLGFGKEISEFLFGKPPVFVENELGKFKLHETKSTFRDANGKKRPFNYNYYEGEAVWHGAESKISATVCCNDDQNADNGFKRLKWAVENSAELEKRLIDYTLNDFIDHEHPDEPIEIWSTGYDDDSDEEPDPMPPEEFRKHISVGYICVEDDGTIDIDMDLDGLFTDHGFMICIDKDGNIIRGVLWG
ncbi:MAG: DUF2262 domain-containing protein [Oscillospiraceae bacterium]|nr:DUF2262 domain-containing protein [Oscillospiraceae bacterium]